jgi:hypothetical protein
LIAEGSSKLASVPSGGGGGVAAPAAGAPAAAAAEEKKEEKKEEEKVSWCLFCASPSLMDLLVSRRNQTTTWASVYSIDHMYICSSGKYIRVSLYSNRLGRVIQSKSLCLNV